MPSTQVYHTPPPPESLKALAAAGAQFVLASLPTKQPVADKGWHKKKPSLADLQAHLAKPNAIVGFRPVSLGLLVVDFDHPRLSPEIVPEALGPPLAQIETSRPGRYHFIYRSPDAKVPTRPWADPETGVKGGELRGHSGYAVIWNAPALVEALAKLPNAAAPDVSRLPKWTARNDPEHGRSATRAEELRATSPGARNESLYRSTVARPGQADDLAKAALDAGLPPEEIEATIESAQRGAMEARLNPDPRDPAKLLDALDPTASMARFLDAEASRLMLVELPEGLGEVFVLSSSGIWRRDYGLTVHLFEQANRVAIGEWEKTQAADNDDANKIVRRYRRDLHREAHYVEAVKRAPAALRRLQGTEAGAPPALEVVDHDQVDPPGRYIGCDGGILDLFSGTLLPPHEGGKHHITRSTLVEYDPAAKHEDVDKLFAHVGDDEKRWLLGAFGHALCGKPNRRIYLVSGPPRGGKSTLMTALSAATGEYSATLAPAALESDRRSSGAATPELIPFTRARFVFAPELEVSSRAASGLLKQLSGGDEITTRDLYQTYAAPRRVSATLFAVANQGQEPRFNLADPGLDDRVRVLPYPAVPDAALDWGLRDRLANDDAAKRAMLALLVQHAGLHHAAPPDDIAPVAQARRELLLETAGVELSEWLETTVCRGAGYWPTADAWARAKEFCAGDNKPWGLSPRSFKERLTALLQIEPPRQYSIPNGGRRTAWRGVRLRTVADPPGLGPLYAPPEQAELTGGQCGACGIPRVNPAEFDKAGVCLDREDCDRRFEQAQGGA